MLPNKVECMLTRLPWWFRTWCCSGRRLHHGINVLLQRQRLFLLDKPKNVSVPLQCHKTSINSERMSVLKRFASPLWSGPHGANPVERPAWSMLRRTEWSMSSTSHQDVIQQCLLCSTFHASYPTWHLDAL